MAVFTLFFLAPTLVKSQENYVWLSVQESFGLISHARVIVNDQIDGNCWTNFSSIASKAKLEFERSNVKIYDYEPASRSIFNPDIYLHGLGYRTESGLCVGAAKINVIFNPNTNASIADTDISYTFSIVGESYESWLIASSLGNLNQQFENFFEGEVAEIASKIISQRRVSNVKFILDRLPTPRQDPMSQQAWNDIIKEIENSAN